MGQGYLADTNTLIDYLDNKLPDKANNLLDNITIHFSVITRIELLVWPKATEEQLDILNAFVKNSSVLNLSEEVILKTIEIRRLHRVKLPDALIAATATINNLILLTRNTDDFKNITSLDYKNPYQL